VRATALPAPAAAGAEKKRRKVLREQTNTPVIMPAPTECSAPRIRGKARSRTNAPSVGAAQRLGPNLEKLSDTAECFAVEGTVTGELGRQHYACGVAVGIIGGRVSPGSRGGPVSVEDKKAAAEVSETNADNVKTFQRPAASAHARFNESMGGSPVIGWGANGTPKNTSLQRLWARKCAASLISGGRNLPGL